MKSLTKPSLSAMIVIERKAWNEMVQLMHDKDLTFSDAIKTIKQDALFWTAELNYKPKTMIDNWKDSWPSPTRKGDHKGKGKEDKGKGKPDKGKGKADKGMKGKKTGKATPSTAPVAKTFKFGKAQMTGLMPNGKQSCKNFIVNDNCPGLCGRSHNCPYWDGITTCNKNYSQCPHFYG